MREFNKNNWKKKIDPTFDRFVRIYAGFLTQLEENPNKGRLNFPDDLIEPIIKKSGWQGGYSEDLKSHEDMFSYLKRAGALSDKEINLYFRAFESLENYDEALKICFEITKDLKEEESRQFYTSKLNSFINNPDSRPDTNEVDKNSIDFYSVVTSLLFHYLFAKLFEDEKEIINDEIEYFKTSNAMTSFLGVILSSFSNIANQISIADLKDKISKGDDKALFKAVIIDKSFLSTEDVKNRIIKAQLSGDADFFKRLGRAIADNPLKKVGRHGKTYSVIRLFWFLGLYKLTYSELYDFLVFCDLTPPGYPEAFEKFMKRHIKSVYKF